MIRRRIADLRTALGRERLDGLLVTSAVNISYLSHAADSIWALISRRSALIMPSQLSDYSVRCAVKAPWRVLDWRNPGKRLERAIKNDAIHRLGVESGRMNVSYFHSLRRRLGNSVLLVPCNGMLEKIRETKDRDELETMTKAGAISAEIARELELTIRPGRTERAVAAEIDSRMRNLGADGPAFDTIVLGGSRTTHPHGRPGERRFVPGDLCLIDFGAKLSGYCTDVTRVLCIPPATHLMRRRYALVRRAYMTAAAAARAGAACEKVDEAARKIIGRDKSRFIHSLGHGVGMEIHEGPRLGAGEKKKLQISNVITIEPGIYYPGWGAIRLENTLVIAKNGSRSLTGEIPPELPAGRRPGWEGK